MTVPKMLVYLLRHGERADEAGESSDVLDPPLTPIGLEQARSTWRGILSEISDPSSSLSIFSSSLSRCLSTAKSCNLPMEVEVVPGLSYAAAICHFGGMLSPYIPDRIRPSRSLDLVSTLPPLNSQCNFKLSSPPSSLSSPSGQFLEAVKYSVKKSSLLSRPYCVIVTHREGIRDFMQITGAADVRVRTPYCCAAKFEVDEGSMDDLESGGWRFEEMLVPGDIVK